MNLILFGIAFIAGAAISVQAAVNSQLAGGLGGSTAVAALVSFAVGTVALATIALSSGGLPAVIASLPAQPWWRFSGGLLGAAAIFSTVLLAPRIGLANMLTLVIAGQLLSSMLIDHFGLVGMVVRPASVFKLSGALIVMAGVLLTLWGDVIGEIVGRTH
jgi:transporter family-2 protein